MNRTLRKTRPTQWLGNGCGTAAASYALVEDGKVIADVWYGVRWTARFADGRQVHAEKLADLREKLFSCDAYFSC